MIAAVTALAIIPALFSPWRGEGVSEAGRRPPPALLGPAEVVIDEVIWAPWTHGSLLEKTL